MRTSTPLTSRKRKSKPKTRSGCLTCKIRHVKCDEGKPECVRCLKFGVKCEGYRPPHEKPVSKSRPLHPKFKTTPGSTILARSPFANDEEHRYFDVFCTRTSVEILPSHDIGSTRQILLQSCYTNPSIRHAIIAIGALDETSSMTRDFGTMSFNDPDWTVNANKHHQNALKQYAKAIRHMSTATYNRQVDLQTALLTCLLVICFEAWNGDLKLAVNQILVGVNLILEWKAKNGGIKNAGLIPKTSVVEMDLIQIFCRLAIQVRRFRFDLGSCVWAPAGSWDVQPKYILTALSQMCYFGLGTFAAAETPESHCRTLLGTEGKILTRTMPESFSNLQEAETYQTGLMRRGVHFVSSYTNNYTPEMLPFLLREQADIKAQVIRWLQNFEKLKRNVSPGRESRFAWALQLQLITGYTQTHAALSSDATIHDDCDDFYEQVVDLSAKLLNDSALSSDMRGTNYSFDNRVILPAFLAGIHCRNSTVRKKTIALLLNYPRREGIWDSLCTGKMVQWIVDLENVYSEDGYIPGWARTYGLKWDSDLENRSALLTCYQKSSRFASEAELKQTRISW